MNLQRPVNKPLIIFTLVLLIFISVADEFTEPIYYSDRQAFILGAASILLSPLFIIWLKALWNNVIPNFTSWREITFWEAAGLLALLAFIHV